MIPEKPTRRYGRKQENMMQDKHDKRVFGSDFDPDYKAAVEALRNAENLIGWKDLYFLIRHYQEHEHPTTAYNFDKLKL